MKSNLCKPAHLVTLCQYIQMRREGDFIEAKNFTRTYLGFDSISSDELNALCQLAIDYLILPNESIYWSMGEIIFVINPQQELEV